MSAEAGLFVWLAAWESEGTAATEERARLREGTSDADVDTGAGAAWSGTPESTDAFAAGSVGRESMPGWKEGRTCFTNAV